MFYVRYLLKLSLVIAFVVQLNAASDINNPDEQPLSIIDVGIGLRLTNVPINTVLYPDAKLAQACCIHPYNPDFHTFPIVINYTQLKLEV